MRTENELDEIFLKLKAKFGVPVRRKTIVKRYGDVLDRSDIKRLVAMMKAWSAKCHVDRQELLNERKNRLIQEATQPELCLKKHFEDLKLEFEFQKGCIRGYCFFILDFFFPEQKIGIELDGSSHKNKKDADRKRTRWLKRHKFVSKIIRFKNEDVFSKSGLKKIERALIKNNILKSADTNLSVSNVVEVKCPCCLSFFKIEL